MRKLSFREALAHGLAHVRRFISREPDNPAAEKNVAHAVLEAVEQGYDDVNGYQNHIKKYVGQYIGPDASREQVADAYKNNAKFRAAIAQIGQEWGYKHWMSRSYFGRTVKQLDDRTRQKWEKVAESIYWTGFYLGFHSAWGVSSKSVQDARSEAIKQYPEIKG